VKKLNTWWSALAEMWKVNFPLNPLKSHTYINVKNISPPEILMDKAEVYGG